MHKARRFLFVCVRLLCLTAIGGCSKKDSLLKPRLGSYKFVQAWGDSGTGNGQFRFPWDVAVDASGKVYVTDTDNHRVQKFTSTGTYLTQWGAGAGTDSSPALRAWRWTPAGGSM